MEAVLNACGDAVEERVIGDDDRLQTEHNVQLDGHGDEHEDDVDDVPSKTRMPGMGGGGEEENGWVAEEEGKQHKV